MHASQKRLASAGMNPDLLTDEGKAVTNFQRTLPPPQTALLEQRHQRSEPGGVDLLTRPPGAIRGGGCHNLFASGVE